MNEERAQRLNKKYNGSGKTGAKKELMLYSKIRGTAKKEKPRNTKATLLRLLKYLAHERVLIVLALSLAAANAGFSLASSYILRPIINKHLYFDPAAGDLSLRLQGFLASLMGLVALYVGVFVTHYVQQRIMLSVSQRSLHRMREDLYSKLQTLPIRYFDTHSTGDVMSRFANDIDAVGEMLNTTLVQIITGVITLVGTLFMMLYTSPILGSITLLMTPLLTWLSKFILNKSANAYTRQQRSLGTLNGFVEEMISGQKVVKVFGHEEIAMDEFEYLNTQLRDAQSMAQFCSGVLGPATHQLCNVGFAVTATLGGILVVTRGFDLGGLAVSLNYTRQFSRPISDVSTQMNTVVSALAGAERVFEVMDETPENADEDEDTVCPESLRGEIVMEHVSFGYTPETTVLHDISLYAHVGQKIAFVGSTGAGKTTVTNLLSRFYEIQEGSITIDGIPIEKIDRACLRRNIAMVLQDTHLFTGTVRENIRYGRLDATDEEVIAAAKVASAHNFIMHLQNGYDTVLENDGAGLSQGQRQLLNIARAAISKAPILILDEATSSVDTRTERHIDKGMDAIMKNRTTLVIAHRLSTVRTANAIMVMEKGRIIERGDHDDLLAMNGRYADLYHEIAKLE